MVCPQRESIEPIALPGGQGDASGLQEFVGAGPWPYDEVQAEAQALFADGLAPSAAGAPVGVVGGIDESAFTKKGAHSAGVARLHNGRLGKEDNCQAGVFPVGVPRRGRPCSIICCSCPSRGARRRGRRKAVGIRRTSPRT